MENKVDKPKCKKCGKYSNFFLTVWDTDKYGQKYAVALCEKCFADSQIKPLFGILKSQPKNEELINE